MSCEHAVTEGCWTCFDAFVDAEVERWLRRPSHKTRTASLLRENIVRGLMIGTYELGSRAGIRAYTPSPSYGIITLAEGTSGSAELAHRVTSDTASFLAGRALSKPFRNQEGGVFVASEHGGSA